MRFRDRAHAGEQLAAHLADLASEPVVVLGLPRGGVPVAAPVADALDAPLDVVVARKVGAPGHPEFGVGAVAEERITVIDEATIRRLGITWEDLQPTVERELQEVERRVEAYRQGHDAVPLSGRVAVLVDDGLATGVSAEAAARSAARRLPSRVVVAAPVGAPATVARLQHVAQDVVCAETPPDFMAVGQWYDDFTQTTDDEVVDLLARRRHRAEAAHR